VDVDGALVDGARVSQVIREGVKWIANLWVRYDPAALKRDLEMDRAPSVDGGLR